MADVRRIAAALQHVNRAKEVWRCITAFHDAPQLVATYVGLSSPTLPSTVRSRAGHSFRLEEFYDIETLWQIYCRRVYRVQAGARVIVDAGANIGLFTIFAAAMAPDAQIHAVEPFPSTFTRLTSHIVENRLSSRVRCHKTALGRGPSVAIMSGGASASQMYHVVSNEDPAASSPGLQHVTVDTVSLTEFFTSIESPEVDLLKMDIEGSEYDVLLSTSTDILRRCHRLVVEYHARQTPAAPGPRELAAHVVAAGFHVQEASANTADYGLLDFVRA